MKPHIKKAGTVFRMYVCEGRGVKGSGYTPRHAYFEWRNARAQRKLAAFTMLRLKRSMGPQQFKRFYPLEKNDPVAVNRVKC